MVNIFFYNPNQIRLEIDSCPASGKHAVFCAWNFDKSEYEIDQFDESFFDGRITKNDLCKLQGAAWSNTRSLSAIRILKIMVFDDTGICLSDCGRSGHCLLCPQEISHEQMD